MNIHNSSYHGLASRLAMRKHTRHCWPSPFVMHPLNNHLSQQYLARVSSPAPCRSFSTLPSSHPSSYSPSDAGAPASSAPSLTEHIFAKVDALEADAQAQGAGGRTTYEAFRAVEEQWARVRAGADEGSPPQFVREVALPLPLPPAFDVVVCGGTLGVFLAAALAGRGLRVAVVERGPLRGRAQEWNISRKELLELEHVGVATREELEACIAIEFNPVRVGFAWQPPVRYDNHTRTSAHSAAAASIPSSASTAPTSGTSTTAAAHTTAAGVTATATASATASSGAGGFKGTEVWTRDVLNLGVRPDALVGLMRRKLEAAGGVVLERTALGGISVHPNGCSLSIRPEGGAHTGNQAAACPASLSSTSSSSAATPSPRPPAPLTTRLILDCMGHFSPIVRQVRCGSRPDGVCLVVGSMGSGFPCNTSADVILTTTPLQPEDATFNRAQYFWEAFPAAHCPSARTTYMFTYTTAEPYRPPLAAMFEDYWRLMPAYQGVRLEDIDVRRVLFGFFPAYKDTPLKPAFDRILQVGDAGGLQSPLSFGGLAALTRHLTRLTRAVTEAVEADALDRTSLGLITAYNPGLASSWMMQKAMSIRQGEHPPPQLINRMLSGNFLAMERMGEPVMKPFLQDVIQCGPMVRTLTAQMLSDPATIPALISHVGPVPLLEWMGHMACLAAYTAAHATASLLRLRAAVADAPALSARARFTINRWLDAWEYGSGQDYTL